MKTIIVPNKGSQFIVCHDGIIAVSDNDININKKLFTRISPILNNNNFEYSVTPSGGRLKINSINKNEMLIGNKVYAKIEPEKIIEGFEIPESKLKVENAFLKVFCLISKSNIILAYQTKYNERYLYMTCRKNHSNVFSYNGEELTNSLIPIQTIFPGQFDCVIKNNQIAISNNWLEYFDHDYNYDFVIKVMVSAQNLAEIELISSYLDVDNNIIGRTIN